MLNDRSVKSRWWCLGVVLLLSGAGYFQVVADEKPTADQIVRKHEATKAPSPSPADLAVMREKATKPVADKSNCSPPKPLGDDPPKPSTYRISGPTAAVANEMVILTADGTGAKTVQWMPSSDDEFQQRAFDYASLTEPPVIERNKFFAFRMPAASPKQTFIVLVSLHGADPQMLKYSVKLDGPAPDVDPKPPGPNPPGPTPIPSDSFKVLILEETAERTPAIAAVVGSKAVRDYLNTKAGAKGWHVWDDDLTDADFKAAGASDDWKAWHAQAKTDSQGKLPWLLVSNGKTGVSQALPATPERLLEVLKFYGGE